jgi:hypothetical protein
MTPVETPSADESDGSIQKVKNLTGKIQFTKQELQVSEDKYLLSGYRIKFNPGSFASDRCLPARYYTHEKS